MIEAIAHNYKKKDKFAFENMRINYCITDPKSLLNVTLYAWWLLYIHIISLTVSLSWKEFKHSSSDEGFFPEEFFTMFM